MSGASSNKIRRGEATSALADLRESLAQYADPERARHMQRYFKTGPGEYGEGDRFMGIAMPRLRRVAGKYRDLPLRDVEILLGSAQHEERVVALLILVDQYRRGAPDVKESIHQTYLTHAAHVNNWDLVDLSAEHLLGTHLEQTDTALLETLAGSESLWERRMAVIATRYFIRRGEFEPTFEIAERLLDDGHDLIHKAVGWMLREVGKSDLSAAEAFLKIHYRSMPRTMLRYAVERLPESRSKQYLRGEV